MDCYRVYVQGIRGKYSESEEEQRSLVLGNTRLEMPYRIARGLGAMFSVTTVDSITLCDCRLLTMSSERLLH